MASTKTARKGNKSASKKATKDEAAEAVKAAEAKKAEAKAAKEAEKAERAKEREEKRKIERELKEAERQEAIDSGAIVVDGDVEYHEVDKSDKPATVDKRTAAIIEDLRENGTKVPLLGKDLHEKHGGSWALMIPVFSTLKAQGLVREYRRRTGERGGSGVAYLWIG